MVAATYAADKATLILAVESDLLSTNAEACAVEIEGHLIKFAPQKWKQLDLDLRNSRMVDSVGLNVIIGLMKKMEKKKRSVRIFIASPSVKRVFEFSGISRHAQIEFKRHRGW